MRDIMCIMAVLWLVSLSDVLGQSVTTMELWIDDDYTGRQTIESIDSSTIKVDVSGLHDGLHRLQLRVCDSEERWSAPLCRYFYYDPDAIPCDSAITYELWIDNDYQDKIQGSSANGVFSLELPVNSLHDGLHRLQLRVGDSEEQWSAPLCRYFYIPDVDVDSTNVIRGYRCWINGQLASMVEVDEANPFTAENLVIDLDGLLPSTIPDDYDMEWESKIVSCGESALYFSMSFCDNWGQWSTATIDTLYYQYPQVVAIVELTDGVTATTAAESGRMIGFHLENSDGDSIMWTVSGGCCLDIYGEDGTRTSRHTVSDALESSFSLTVSAQTGSYAFVYNATSSKIVVKAASLVTSCEQIITIQSVNITVQKNLLMVNGECPCYIYDATGHLVAADLSNSATKRFFLAKGVYLATIVEDQAYTIKVIVP